MNPPFGTLNATLAKTIIANAPKYNSIIEPFGDGGTLALELAKRKPKKHLLNIEDELLFNAFIAVQKMSSNEKKRLKAFDWVASQETFDQVLSINTIDGPDFLYRFLYLKKFGMKMAGADSEADPEFDIASIGDDASDVLMGLPIMIAALKKVTITNDDPLTMLKATGGGFLILLPRKPEHVDAVQSKIGSIGGDFFYAAKSDGMSIVDMAKQNKQYTVTAKKVASIMMATMAIITNYKNKLIPINIEMAEGA